MDPTETKRSVRFLRIALVLALVAGLLAFWIYKRMGTATLSSSVRDDLPILELELQFVNVMGEKIFPKPSRLGTGKRASTEAQRQRPASGAGSEVKGQSLAPASESGAGAEEPAPGSGSEAGPQGSAPGPGSEAGPQGSSPASEAPSAECPTLIGGDTEMPSSLPEREKVPKDCPLKATWFVKRHPIGLSLYCQDGKRVLSFLDEDAPARSFLESRFVQGIFREPLRSARIRAEDMQLDGLRGAFLERLVREALTAQAKLHYDFSHGRKGFVFSFVRQECPFASQALPVMARLLARSGYQVPRLDDLVLEIRVGLQRFFLTQDSGRVYLANGLEALLNVIESLPPPSRHLPKTPLAVTVRLEAFLDKLPALLVASPACEVDLGLGLSSSDPGVLRFPRGNYLAHLHPRIFKGVLGSIPHDAFGAVATSFHLSPGMTPQEWLKLATQGPSGAPSPAGPEEAGVAVVWDLSAQDGQPSGVGVIIANQTAPEESGRFQPYFTHPELTATCGDGRIFLAASSQTLLARMKESCERQSLSVLDWERGKRSGDFESAQIFCFLNPGAGMRELFLAGGAGPGDLSDFEPDWKQQYERAKENMRQDCDRVTASLPILIYAGRPAPGAEVADLQGFIVSQGVLP